MIDLNYNQIIHKLMNRRYFAMKYDVTAAVVGTGFMGRNILRLLKNLFQKLSYVQVIQ